MGRALPNRRGWTSHAKSGRQSPAMTASDVILSRRTLLAGVAATVATGGPPALAANDVAIPLALTLKTSPAGSERAVFLVDAARGDAGLRFRRGEVLRLAVTSALEQPVLINARGFDGLSALEPLLVQPPLQPGATFRGDLPLTNAGIFALDAQAFDGPAFDGAHTPMPVLPIVVDDPAEPQVDRDQTLLLSEKGATYEINGQPHLDLPLRAAERVRLRLINGCPRKALALQVPDHAVQVIAMDSRPTEPFPAREGRLVLAPGARIEVMFDATAAPGTISPIQLFDGTGPKEIARLVYTADAPVRPQPLAAIKPMTVVTPLDLRNALRSELVLAGSAADAKWQTASSLLAGRGEPAFRIKRGRTAVLALKNTTKAPQVFRLHGHHVRWLDRLDDGWKPFVLDTLVLDTGQTERIAFAAEHAGAWLMEAVPLEASAPGRLRWFAVD